MKDQNSTNGCCEKCKEYREAPDGGGSYYVCVKSTCPCHTKPTGEGEKEVFTTGFMEIVSDLNWTDDAPYNQRDHYHCWQEEKPPCGQRIEHLKCCLCELPNPKRLTI